MKNQIAVVALFVAVFGVAQSQDIQACVQKMTDAITPLMSGGITNPDEIKSKFCPVLKDFFRCGLKASSAERPSEQQLKDLEQSMQQSSQAFTQQLDCEINFSQIADEVWNSASSARPLSILATIMVAFLALFLSTKKL